MPATPHPPPPSPNIALLVESQEQVFRAVVQRVQQALLAPETHLAFTEDTTRGELRTLQVARHLGSANAAALIERFAAALRNRRGDAHNDAPSPKTRPARLALIADDALDTDIAIGKLVRKTLSELDPESVSALELRIGELRGSAPVESDSNPLGARPLLLALYEACEAASAEAEVRIALASLLQPHVTLALAESYDQVNQALISAGVMPELVYRVAKSDDSGAPRRSEAHADGRGASDGKTRLGLTQAMSLAELLPSLHALPTMLELQRLLRALGARPEGPAPLGASILSDAKNAYHGAAVEAPTDPQTLAALDALQMLKSDALDAQADPLATVKAAASGDLDPLDQLTGQLVAVVLDFVLRDADIAPAAKREIARLQIVGYRAALLDRTFFARRDHPFRRLLDRIAELGADPIHAARGSAFENTLVRITDALVSDFHDDLAIFDEKLAELQATLEFADGGDDAALQAAVAALPELETLAAVRDRATAAVAGPHPADTPAWVVEFLGSTWVDVLIATWRARAGDALWQERVALAERLVWSLQPHARANIGEVSRALPAIVGGVRGAMESTGIDPAVRAALMQRLFEAHQAVIRQVRAAQAPPAADAPLQFTLAPRATALPASPVSSLRAGLDLLLDAQGEALRARVVEIGAEQRLCVLVTATGEVRHLRCEELERDIATGKVRVLSQTAGIVERALAGMAEADAAAAAVDAATGASASGSSATSD